MNKQLTKEDLDFNESISTWKGVMLRDMTRNELHKAFNELGKLYSKLLSEHLNK